MVCRLTHGIHRIFSFKMLHIYNTVTPIFSFNLGFMGKIYFAIIPLLLRRREEGSGNVKLVTYFIFSDRWIKKSTYKIGKAHFLNLACVWQAGFNICDIIGSFLIDEKSAQFTSFT